MEEDELLASEAARRGWEKNMDKALIEINRIAHEAMARLHAEENSKNTNNNRPTESNTFSTSSSNSRYS